MGSVPTRPQTRDRLPSTKAGSAKPMRMVSLTADGLTIVCSCGWSVFHQRTKPREDSAERHLNRKHNGKGIWV